MYVCINIKKLLYEIAILLINTTIELFKVTNEENFGSIFRQKATIPIG